MRSYTEAAFRSCDNGRVLVDRLTAIHTQWLERITARRDAAVWRALPVIVSQPAVTVQYLADRIGVSFTAGQRAIDQLVTAGILTPAGSRQRSRAWTADEIVRSLDDFAVRAGRRRGAV